MKKEYSSHKSLFNLKLDEVLKDKDKDKNYWYKNSFSKKNQINLKKLEISEKDK